MKTIINFDYELLRSKRKTISISITKELKVIIRAPIFMKDMDIEIFLIKHQIWIEKNLEKMKNRIEVKQSFSFLDGEEIIYFGHKYFITTHSAANPVCIDGELMVISDKIINREAAVIKFLKQKANEYLIQRADYYSNIIKVVPPGVKITSAKTRWGSCSGKNNICFSYRVMCLPPQIIDYIVVHELAHIKQHNHSKKFYNEVLKYLPDYKQRVLDLKKFQKQMMI